MRAILILCRISSQVVYRFPSLVRVSHLSPVQRLPCWLGPVRCGPTNRRRRNRNLQTRRAKMRKSRSVLKYNTMADVNNRATRRGKSAKAHRNLARRCKKARRQINHQKVASQRPGMRKAMKSFAMMGAHKD